VDGKRMADLFLGIDIGGTVAKAAVFDDRGRQRAVAAEERPGLFPRPGHAERRTEDAWAAAVAAIRRVLDAGGVDPGAIAALCVTGHGNGAYLLDRAGRPLGHGILSIDARATALLEELRRDGSAAALEAIVGRRAIVGET